MPDDSKERLQVLRDKYTTMQEVGGSGKPTCRLTLDKGKGKAEANVLSHDNIPELH